MEGEFLSPQKIAEMLGVTHWTVRRWINSGLLKAEKVGPKLWRIKEEDFAKFMQSRKG